MNSRFENLQEMLNSPSLKLKEAKDVRCEAIGLVKVMKCYEFVACLYLMCEVLPHLTHLSRLFQAEYIQLSVIRPYLSACIKSLTAYKNGGKANDVIATDLALADQLQPFSISVSLQHKQALDQKVRQPFLQHLLQNLEDRFPKAELLSTFSL